MSLVILGLGNDLIGDDAIGLLAARALAPFASSEVAVRAAGQSGLYLLEHLQGFDDAIVVDSVLGDHPGTLRDLSDSGLHESIVPSAHYVGLPEALALARTSGLEVPRRLRIIGVEIDVAQGIGSPPSPEVIACVPRLVERVLRAARDWGYDLAGPSVAEVTPDA